VNVSTERCNWHFVKICLHYGVLCAGPDMRDNTDSKAEATFPYLVPEPAIKERCMYTVSREDIVSSI